jgi:hypothetical protein
MLKKLKVTSCVFILCLFGLTLMPVSPVSAQTFPECSEMKKGSKKKECRRACKEYAESAGRTGKCAMPVSLTPLEQAISDVNALCGVLLGPPRTPMSRAVTEEICMGNVSGSRYDNQMTSNTDGSH